MVPTIPSTCSQSLRFSTVCILDALFSCLELFRQWCFRDEIQGLDPFISSTEMSSLTSGDTLTLATTETSLSPAASSILPYTKGLTGVNLWLNSITSDALYASLGFIIVVILIIRVVQAASTYVRFLATLNSTAEQQRYWTHDSPIWSRFKKHLLVAPLIHKRHNKEIQLSSAVNVGTLPSRLHTVFLSFYLLTNILYCCLLDYHNQPRAALLAEARGRTGHLSVMNMLPLFIFSARNNPLIPLLGISFDTFNLFHRWIGRVVVIETVSHAFIWGVNNYDALGLQGLMDHLQSDAFLICGLVSAVSMLAIILHSVSAIRHAFYETFLHIHQALAVVTVVGILLHCEIQSLPQKPFVYTFISLWGVERLIRLFRVFSRRGTKVQIEALEGGACRVTFDMPGSWTKSPGCHIYAYIPAVSLWMSHPFSVAWVDRDPIIYDNWSQASNTVRSLRPLPSNDSGLDQIIWRKNKRTVISCIIASRSGMTAGLYRKAKGTPSGIIRLSAFVEGPYGGLEKLRSYGTVLLFAGGVGITHQLSHLYDLVFAFSDLTCSTRKVILIWSVRTENQLEWARPWLNEVLEMPKRGNSVNVTSYVTRPTHQDGDATIKEMGNSMLHINFGRMCVSQILEREFQERVGAMSVGVCGPGGLADDVRAATRALMGRGKVDFWEEGFTW